jgi:hypothetical protein
LGGLFSASEKAVEDYAKRDKDGKHNKVACMNCVLWPPLVGITDLTKDPEVRKGFMKSWFTAALADKDFECHCYVNGEQKDRDHEACKRFQTCYDLAKDQKKESDEVYQEACLDEACTKEQCEGECAIEKVEKDLKEEHNTFF